MIRLLSCIVFSAFIFSVLGCDKTGEMNAVPIPDLVLEDHSFLEGDDEDTNVELMISLASIAQERIVLTYSTSEITAESNSDYIAVNRGQLVFDVGEMSKTITVRLIGDDYGEQDESFSITFSDANNPDVDLGSLVVTIENNDDINNPYGVPTSGYSTPEAYTGMQLAWADEFSDESLNQEDWTFEIGTGNSGWGNNELQYYREENTTFSQDALVVEAKRMLYSGSAYTSSRLITLDKQEFQYGRIDIRAAMPEGQGLWPALWMLGANITEVGWPTCGEIDIMEYLGQEVNVVHGTAHYGATPYQHQYIGRSISIEEGESFSDEYHVFSVIWEEDRIEWLMDDISYYVLTKENVGTNPWPFNAPFFFIINMAVGGNWPGPPNALTSFPQYLIVDYIRIFQRI